MAPSCFSDTGADVVGNLSAPFDFAGLNGSRGMDDDDAEGCESAAAEPLLKSTEPKEVRRRASLHLKGKRAV